MKKKALAGFTLAAAAITSLALLTRNKTRKKYSLNELTIDLDTSSANKTKDSKIKNLFAKKRKGQPKWYTRVTESDCPYKIEVDDKYL